MSKVHVVLTNTHVLKNQESSGTEFQRHVGPQLSPGAPNGGVPQNICSAEEIQLAGKLIIAADFSWEFRTFPRFRAELAGLSKRLGETGNTLWYIRHVRSIFC